VGLERDACVGEQAVRNARQPGGGERIVLEQPELDDGRQGVRDLLVAELDRQPETVLQPLQRLVEAPGLEQEAAQVVAGDRLVRLEPRALLEGEGLVIGPIGGAGLIFGIPIWTLGTTAFLLLRAPEPRRVPVTA
jgi:hypothetical protein